VHDAVLLLQQAVTCTSRRMGAQAVPNTLWAFATMKQPLGVAQKPLLHALLRVSGKMNAQDVANTLWAMSKPEFHHSRVACHSCCAVSRSGCWSSLEAVPQVRRGLQWMKLQR
jgi:hypothetical protein